MYRTNNCGELTIKDINKEVELSGWVQKIRNLGGMVFIDLRDEFGITQVILNTDIATDILKDINQESCIYIKRKCCGKK